MELLAGFLSGMGLTLVVVLLYAWKVIYPRIQATVRDAYAIGFQNGQASNMDFSVNRMDI